MTSNSYRPEDYEDRAVKAEAEVLQLKDDYNRCKADLSAAKDRIGELEGRLCNKCGCGKPAPKPQPTPPGCPASYAPPCDPECERECAVGDQPEADPHCDGCGEYPCDGVPQQQSDWGYIGARHADGIHWCCYQAPEPTGSGIFRRAAEIRDGVESAGDGDAPGANRCSVCGDGYPGCHCQTVKNTEAMRALEERIADIEDGLEIVDGRTRKGGGS